MGTFIPVPEAALKHRYQARNDLKEPCDSGHRFEYYPDVEIFLETMKSREGHRDFISNAIDYLITGQSFEQTTGRKIK